MTQCMHVVQVLRTVLSSNEQYANLLTVPQVNGALEQAAGT